MSKRDLVVVGAGISGLTLAAELAGHAAVTLVDRLPAVGGVLGYEHPLVRELHDVVRRWFADELLGTTALRWNDNRLLVAGPRGIEWIAAGCLAFCGGSRPSTTAELGIGGDRPAGVYSATVAIHLMEAGVKLGNTVLVVGASDWATRAVDHLEKQDARIVRVLADGEDGSFRHERWHGWRVVEVRGAARLSHAILARDGLRQRVSCDALILGSQLKALRNVDGAIFGGRNVTYVQPVSDKTNATAVEAHARAAAARLLASMGGTP
jgi:NADPH-dependent 2,4-dienoyl-CoA reductase/sulfur reductase-like enzyme